MVDRRSIRDTKTARKSFPDLSKKNIACDEGENEVVEEESIKRSKVFDP